MTMRRAFSSVKSAPIAPQRRCAAVRAHAQRRDVFLAGAGTVLAGSAAAPQGADAAEKFDMPISQLSTFERADQRNEVLKRAQTEVMKQCSKEDSHIALRLVFNDAATFNVADGTGGMDGSIVLNKDEMSRPENKGLADYVKRLGKAKEAIDARNKELGSAPISWADLMCVACKITTQEEWKQIKIKRAARPDGGDQIVRAFGSQWDLRLGRVDRDAAPPGRALAPGADMEEMRKFMLQLGAKPGDGGPFAAKPPFWERPAFVIYPATQDDPIGFEQKLAAENKDFSTWKKKYDQERETTTRTTYEVDFINYFTKLTSLGAKFDSDAYLHSVISYKLQ